MQMQYRWTDAQTPSCLRLAVKRCTEWLCLPFASAALPRLSLTMSGYAKITGRGGKCEIQVSGRAYSASLYCRDSAFKVDRLFDPAAAAKASNQVSLSSLHKASADLP